MIQRFQRNAFNLTSSVSLRYIDATKGRGVVAERDLPAGTCLALFPGSQVARIPDDTPLPRSTWSDRHRDSAMLDAQQELMPLSRYAITVGVLDFDASEAETGYHYRILDPCFDDPTTAPALEQLWDEYRDLDTWFPDEPIAIPDNVRFLIDFKAKSLYERLKMPSNSIRLLPQSDARLYEFLLDATANRIVMHMAGRLHFVCDASRLRDERECRRNIVLALNTEWDPKSSKQRTIVARAKFLRLSDEYAHIGAFLNEPYEHETANVELRDPSDWVPEMSHRNPTTFPHLATLIQETRADMTTERLDYLQRQLMVTTRAVKRGEELLVDYNRQ